MQCARTTPATAWLISDDQPILCGRFVNGLCWKGKWTERQSRQRLTKTFQIVNFCHKVLSFCRLVSYECLEFICLVINFPRGRNDLYAIRSLTQRIYMTLNPCTCLFRATHSYLYIQFIIYNEWSRKNKIKIKLQKNQKPSAIIYHKRHRKF